MKEKISLDNCYGKVPAGELCAIMGASGAGKSSLLNVLAGRSSSGAQTKIHGVVSIDGQRIDPVNYRENIAYVMQED